jgi:hypothetical protein
MCVCVCACAVELFISTLADNAKVGVCVYVCVSHAAHDAQQSVLVANEVQCEYVELARTVYTHRI